MDSVEKEPLRQEVDALAAALEAERFRHVAGLEARPELAKLFRERSRAAHKDTVGVLRAEGETALAARVAALRAERVAAEDEEDWREAEASAAGRGPEGLVRLEDAALAILAERNRDRRRAFGQAVAEAASAAAPPREAAVEKRARARAEVGLSPDWDRVIEADELLARSDDGYADVLAWMSRRELEAAPLPRGDLERADLLHLVALPRYAGLFPAGMLQVVLGWVVEKLGLDLGRIRVDDAARPAQWPGAHAFGTRVSLRRMGGAADYLGLFAAAGAALATAHSPAGRDRTLAPAVGGLLAGLFLDPRFLGERLAVEKRDAADLVRALALRRLFELRARAAALRVATEVERGTSGAAWRNAHRDALSAAALAAWPDGLAARDGDAAGLAAALAGAAWAEKLRRELVERYDEDWWKNPRTGPALAGLLAGGAPGPEPERPKLALAAEGLVARMA